MSNSNNAQTSLSLDPRVFAVGFAQNGQDTPAAGQVASLTSVNNFINFCLTVLGGVQITNGQQITGGSCNPAPLGVLPSTDFIPSCKFSFPRNQHVLPSDPFTIVLSIRNFAVGFLTNPTENYLSAPQALDGQGRIMGYVAIVIEEVESVTSVTPLNPKNFAFFRATASSGTTKDDGTTDITIDTPGLPPSTYRLSSMLRTANSAPILSPVEMRGSSNDIIYFIVNGSHTISATQNSEPVPTAQASGLDPPAPTLPLPSEDSGTRRSVHHSLQGGTIAGIVVGCLLIIVALALVLLFCRKHRRARGVPIQPFQSHQQPNVSTSYMRFWGEFKRRTSHGKSLLATSQPTHLAPASPAMQYREPVSRGGGNSLVVPFVDERTLQLFREFLAARGQEVNQAEVPPAYDELSRRTHSSRQTTLYDVVGNS